MTLFDKGVLDNEVPRIFYWGEDVKEFIKKLEDFCIIHKGTLISTDTFLKIIKEEAGNKLI